MTVHELETSMPAAELTEWFAHFSLQADEVEMARKKANLRRGRL